MTRSAGPFEVRAMLSASENPHYYSVRFHFVDFKFFGSLRRAKSEARRLNESMAYWVKSETGRSWLKSVLKESPRADGVGGGK